MEVVDISCNRHYRTWYPRVSNLPHFFPALLSRLPRLLPPPKPRTDVSPANIEGYLEICPWLRKRPVPPSRLRKAGVGTFEPCVFSHSSLLAVDPLHSGFQRRRRRPTSYIYPLPTASGLITLTSVQQTRDSGGALPRPISDSDQRPRPCIQLNVLVARAQRHRYTPAAGLSSASRAP